jgi:hypothetical protein
MAMSWIEWCKCGRRILKTGQQLTNGGSGKCDICQAEEHTKTFAERLEKLQKEEE